MSRPPALSPAVQVAVAIHDDGYVPVLQHRSGSSIVDLSVVCVTKSVAARRGRYWASIIEDVCLAIGALGTWRGAPSPVVGRLMHTCTLGRPERWCERCEYEDQVHRLATEVG